MTVLLSDTEAENIASLLRRMNERVQTSDESVAYVDDRGPTDFANQIEALVDAGPASVHVPISVGSEVTVYAAHLTPTAAATAARKRAADGVKELSIVDPEADL